MERYFEALPDPTGENVQLTVETYEADETDAFLLQTAWLHAAEEGDALAVPPACRANGLRIGVGGPALRAELSLAGSRASSSRHAETMLTVLNGRTGRIELSEVIASPVTLATWNGRMERQARTFSRVRALLEVRPERMGGDRVRLELTPAVGSDDPAGASLTLAELRTSVVVPRGVPVLIGGHEQENESFGGTFFSKRSNREHRRRIVLVTAK